MVTPRTLELCLESHIHSLDERFRRGEMSEQDYDCEMDQIYREFDQASRQVDNGVVW